MLGATSLHGKSVEHYRWKWALVALHTDEEFDSRTVANGGTVEVDTQCHDGGPGSLSAKCGYGTQVR